jgi:hypothetical protein
MLRPRRRRPAPAPASLAAGGGSGSGSRPRCRASSSHAAVPAPTVSRPRESKARGERPRAETRAHGSVSPGSSASSSIGLPVGQTRKPRFRGFRLRPGRSRTSDPRISLALVRARTVPRVRSASLQKIPRKRDQPCAGLPKLKADEPIPTEGSRSRSVGRLLTVEGRFVSRRRVALSRFADRNAKSS